MTLPQRRITSIAVALLAFPPIALAGIAIDARARRRAASERAPAVSALALRLPTSDLALSGGARWLRGLSLEEPSAAFADGPALPDPDPAGGAIAPPVEAWSEAARQAR